MDSKRAHCPFRVNDLILSHLELELELNANVIGTELRMRRTALVGFGREISMVHINAHAIIPSSCAAVR